MTEVLSDIGAKDLAWRAYVEAWNTVDSTDSMTDLEIRTARNHFESWWSTNHE